MVPSRCPNSNPKLCQSVEEHRQSDRKSTTCKRSGRSRLLVESAVAHCECPDCLCRCSLWTHWGRNRVAPSSNRPADSVLSLPDSSSHRRVCPGIHKRHSYTNLRGVLDGFCGADGSFVVYGTGCDPSDTDSTGRGTVHPTCAYLSQRERQWISGVFELMTSLVKDIDRVEASSVWPDTAR